MEKEKKSQNIIPDSPKSNEIGMALRGLSLKEFEGQAAIKEALEISIQAASMRHDPLDHMLFYGSHGLGKTTLAYTIAMEMKQPLHFIPSRLIRHSSEIIPTLVNLQQGEILLVEEIHLLPHAAKEVLVTAMEDYAVDIKVGSETNVRYIRLDLPKFTLIGTTTRADKLPESLRNCFCNAFCFDLYKSEELATMVRRTAQIYGTAIDDSSLHEIATHSRGIPGVAIKLFKRVRDYAQVRCGGDITISAVHNMFSLMGIYNSDISSITQSENTRRSE